MKIADSGFIESVCGDNEICSTCQAPLYRLKQNIQSHQFCVLKIFYKENAWYNTCIYISHYSAVNYK